MEMLSGPLTNSKEKLLLSEKKKNDEAEEQIYILNEQRQKNELSLQEFMTNEYNENKYMQSYNIESKHQKSIQIILSPQNIEIGNYELVVIMLLNPSFMAKSPNYVFGYNHKISYLVFKFLSGYSITNYKKVEVGTIVHLKSK